MKTNIIHFILGDKETQGTIVDDSDQAAGIVLVDYAGGQVWCCFHKESGKWVAELESEWDDISGILKSK